MADKHQAGGHILQLFLLFTLTHYALLVKQGFQNGFLNCHVGIRRTRILYFFTQ